MRNRWRDCAGAAALDRSPPRAGVRIGVDALFSGLTSPPAAVASHCG